MPTDWEWQYQKGETPWEKGEASPALIDYLALHPLHGRILVPGCGYGHDVRALARTAELVVGFDIAPSAIAAAEQRAKVGSEKYVQGDLFALPAEMHGAFDWVFEHTCFCAIDPSQRADYVKAVAKALKPAGKLLAVFYLNPGNASPGEGPPFEVSVQELDRLFSPRFALLREWLPEHSYPGREGREWMRLMEVVTKAS